MLIENADYFVRLVPFPDGADGAVLTNDDGTFSVYIDKNINRERQLKALEHEINHIEKDHFYSDKPIDVIEAEADNTTLPAPEKQPAQLEADADKWAKSWEKAMLWAETMRSLYGENEIVPLYSP